MNLKTKELERYSRQIIIKDIGISGQKKIKNSKVLIVGLGGFATISESSPVILLLYIVKSNFLSYFLELH